jgi:hypothetical protein
MLHVLADGTRLRLRFIEPGDKALLGRGHAGARGSQLVPGGRRGGRVRAERVDRLADGEPVRR